MNLTLCGACAKARDVHGAHADRYLEKSIGLWRSACDDCGRVGSTGGPENLRSFTYVAPGAPPPASTRPALPESDE